MITLQQQKGLEMKYEEFEREYKKLMREEYHQNKKIKTTLSLLNEQYADLQSMRIEKDRILEVKKLSDSIKGLR